MDAEGDKVSTSLQAVALDILQTLVRAYAVNENSSQQQHTVSRNSLKSGINRTNCFIKAKINIFLKFSNGTAPNGSVTKEKIH